MRGAFFFFAAEERPCRIRIGEKKRAMGHAIGRYTALPALRQYFDTLHTRKVLRSR
jgi:hypothetical protein